MCCSVLQCVAVYISCSADSRTARHCKTLQHSATHCNTMQHTATHCNTLQHTATHCNTLQHTATHCNTLQHTTTHCNTLQRTAKHCKTLQHTATHCNKPEDRTLNIDCMNAILCRQSLCQTRTPAILLIHPCDMTHTYVWHDSFPADSRCTRRELLRCDKFMCVTRPAHTCDMTHTYVAWLIHVWHDPFSVPGANSCGVTNSCAWHDPYICVTWLIHMWHDLSTCDMTHSLPTATVWGANSCDVTNSCVWHDPYTCVTRLIYAWHDPFSTDSLCARRELPWSDSYMCVTRIIHVWRDSYMCDVTHACVTWLIYESQDLSIYVWHDSLPADNHCARRELLWCDKFAWLTWPIHMCDMTRTYVWHDSYIVTWLVHVSHDPFSADSRCARCKLLRCDMFIRVTWLTYVWHDSYMCDMTRIWVTGLIYVWHDSFSADSRCARKLLWCDKFMCVTWLIHVCDITHTCVTSLPYEWHDFIYLWRDEHLWHDPFNKKCMSHVTHTRVIARIHESSSYSFMFLFINMTHSLLIPSWRTLVTWPI